MPGSPSAPPASGPSASPASASAWAFASRYAATIMSPRSARSSGSLPSKPPALISTPTSSPTPLTFTVTAPPATVPSTTVSASRSCAAWSCSCICWACWSRAFMSKPPPPRASKGFWLMGWSHLSRVADLLDHLGAELALEELRRAHALVLGVEVVGVGVGVRRRPVGTGLGLLLVGRPGLLDRVAGGRARVGRRLLLHGCGLRGGLRLRLGHGGPGDRRRALGLGARVDDRLDLPGGADHVDRGLVQHLVAAAAHERVAGAGVRETERERGGVDRDDLAVLGEVHPRQPAAHLGRVDDVGPEPAYVDQTEAARRRGGLRFGGGCGLGGGLRLRLR